MHRADDDGCVDSGKANNFLDGKDRRVSVID